MVVVGIGLGTAAVDVVVTAAVTEVAADAHVMVRQLAIRPQQEAGGVTIQLAHVAVAAVSAPGTEGLPQTPLFCACAGCTSDIANGGIGRLSLSNRRSMRWFSTLNSWVLPAIRLDCIDG